jgi:hypothetical protein
MKPNSPAGQQTINVHVEPEDTVVCNHCKHTHWLMTSVMACPRIPIIGLQDQAVAREAGYICAQCFKPALLPLKTLRQVAAEAASKMEEVNAR